MSDPIRRTEDHVAGATGHQQEPIRRLLIGIFLLMLFGTAYFAKDVILPVVLGILIAITLSPLVRGAERLGVPPPATAGFIIFGLAILGGLAMLLLGGTVSSWMDEIPRITADLRYKLASLSASLQAAQEATEEVQKIADGSGTTQEVVVKQPGLLTAAVGGVAAFGTSLAVAMVMALFLLASGNMFYVKLIQSFPSFRDKRRALRIVYDIEKRISRYLLAITCINAGLGLCVGLVMQAVGLPYAPIWGLAAFALNYLPFLGGLIGAGLVAAVSIVTFDSLGYAMIAPMCYLLLTSIEGQIVTPTLLGNRLEMNTVSVFLTVIFWGWLWGIPGALMAVPFLLLLKVICDNVDGLSVLGNFLSSRDSIAEAPDAVKDVQAVADQLR